MSRGVPALALTGLLLTGMLGAVQLLPERAAGVQVNQSFAMPAEGTVTLRGHGYGHGHGMSQYGAEGAARQGLTWQKIVAFYYPGTTLAKDAGRVRVLISADTTRDVVVAPRSGLVVTDTKTGEVWTLPDNGATRWRLAVADGRTVVAFLTDRWHRWRALTGDGGFRAGGQPITLYAGGEARRYRGMLLAASPSSRLDRPRHGQRAADGQLHQGRDPARDAALLVTRCGPRPGGRGAHLRGVREAAPARRPLPAVRHDLVPGLRRLRRRGQPLQRRGSADRRRDPDVRRRPGVHPVQLQQRRLDRRRTSSPTCRRRRIPTTASRSTRTTTGSRRSTSRGSRSCGPESATSRRSGSPRVTATASGRAARGAWSSADARTATPAR